MVYLVHSCVLFSASGCFISHFKNFMVIKLSMCVHMCYVENWPNHTGKFLKVVILIIAGIRSWIY